MAKKPSAKNSDNKASKVLINDTEISSIKSVVSENDNYTTEPEAEKDEVSIQPTIISVPSERKTLAELNMSEFRVYQKTGLLPLRY